MEQYLYRTKMITESKFVNHLLNFILIIAIVTTGYTWSILNVLEGDIKNTLTYTNMSISIKVLMVSSLLKVIRWLIIKLSEGEIEE